MTFLIYCFSDLLPASAGVADLSVVLCLQLTVYAWISRTHLQEKKKKKKKETQLHLYF